MGYLQAVGKGTESIVNINIDCLISMPNKLLLKTLIKRKNRINLTLIICLFHLIFVIYCNRIYKSKKILHKFQIVTKYMK
mgnify:CR=1 FL=1